MNIHHQSTQLLITLILYFSSFHLFLFHRFPFDDEPTSKPVPPYRKGISPRLMYWGGDGSYYFRKCNSITKCRSNEYCNLAVGECACKFGTQVKSLPQFSAYLLQMNGQKVKYPDEKCRRTDCFGQNHCSEAYGANTECMNTLCICKHSYALDSDKAKCSVKLVDLPEDKMREYAALFSEPECAQNMDCFDRYNNDRSLSCEVYSRKCIKKDKLSEEFREMLSLYDKLTLEQQNTSTNSSKNLSTDSSTDSLTDSPTNSSTNSSTNSTRNSTVESTFEPTFEPTFELRIEPKVKPIVEPSVEPKIEPIVEPIVEPSLKPQPKNEIVKPKNPTIQNLYRAFFDPPPYSEDTISYEDLEIEEMEQENAEKTAEQNLESIVEPNVEPTVEPTLESTVEPTLEPTVEPSLEERVKLQVESKNQQTHNRNHIFCYLDELISYLTLLSIILTIGLICYYFWKYPPKFRCSSLNNRQKETSFKNHEKHHHQVQPPSYDSLMHSNNNFK